MRIVYSSSLVFILLFPVVFCSTAQDKTIYGTVTTFDSILVNGASVKVKSTKEEVYTDSTGNFSVAVADGDMLIVSAKGFYKQKVRLDKKIKFAAVNLKLKPSTKAKEYAIGYGYVSDKEKLNAVSSLDKDDMDFSQYTNIVDLIKGRFPGVDIVNGEVQIRGVNSLNLSTAALIVVDGVQCESSMLGTIPPSQVKSINVLKDGSAAIYGTRGSNGVVIIETRRGND